MLSRVEASQQEPPLAAPETRRWLKAEKKAQGLLQSAAAQRSEARRTAPVAL
jgi:hypothetical protein